ncbi:MAG: TfuA-like protein, partial [Gammaproteobacteria bacterium]
MHYDPTLPLAVFLGPSLAPATARTLRPANYYPPVRMGDIYRLLASGVETIVIIDGVFHQSTPVWQREILAALEAGIRVVGGASMGALRAAELAPYGMEGVGTIYGWYRDGIIDGDDEVALVHADAELGYRAVSEPLVNLRHNLARAHARGLIDASAHDALVACAKAACFSERSWRALAAAAPWQDLPRPRRAALDAFVAGALEDLKRADALAVLAHLGAARPAPAAPPPRARWSYPGSVRTRLQGTLTADGRLLDAA